MMQFDLKHLKFFGALLLVLSAVWIAATAAWAPPSTEGRTPFPRRGFLAPDFALTSFAGETYQLSNLKGQVVLVNYWASWCPPCKAEMPALENVFQDYQDQGLVILAVNVTDQDDQQKAQDFYHNLGLTFPALLDPAGEVSRNYQINALPTTFFIDRRGVIATVIYGGPLAETLLRAEIARLLEDQN